jgi:hypothetical protein
MRWFYDPAYDYGAGIAGLPSEVHGFILRKPSEIAEHLIEMRAADSDVF